MTADSSGNASVNFAAPSSEYGYYRVKATLPGGSSLAGLGTRPAGFVTYAVVPDPAKRVDYGDADSRFGMQGGFSAAQGDVIPFLGIRYILDGPGWGQLEPKSAGQFAAARSAAVAKGQVYPAKSATVTNVSYKGTAWPTYSVPLLTMASLPAWALEPGTNGTICTSMGALNALGVDALPGFAQALAESVAANYATQSSHYYQITWEPESNWCFGGTPSQLVQFYTLTYAAIHRADAKAIVMGPTLFPEDSAALNALWSANLGKYVDAVSMHPYAQWPPETSGLVGNIRTQMKSAQAAKGKSVPFLGTEHGYTSTSIGELNQALGDIRATIILLGEGFKFDFAFYIADFWNGGAFGDQSNYYGYYYNLNSKIDWGTDKIGPKPAAPAFAAMTYILDGTTTVGPLSDLSGTQMGYRFKRNGTTIVAIWDYKAASSTVSLPVPSENIQICDWMGNCKTAASSGGNIMVRLGSSPTYLIGDDL